MNKEVVLKVSGDINLPDDLSGSDITIKIGDSIEFKPSTIKFTNEYGQQFSLAPKRNYMLEEVNKHIGHYKELYLKRHRKKHFGKAAATQILAQETFDIAMSIIAFLKDIPYDELIRDSYFYCKNNEFMWFTREFEKQIELAGANPERFVFQLHNFYNGISAKIKKGHLYSEIVDYLGAYTELSYTCPPEINQRVIEAYKELLLQVQEYLRPDKYNFSQRIIGVTTNEQPLCVKEILPLCEVPMHEIREALDSGKLARKNIREELPKIFAKHGITVQTIEDVSSYSSLERTHTSTISALMPYMNEYTCDIFPQEYYKSKIAPCGDINVRTPLDDLLNVLKARKRALPANGTKIIFEDASCEIVELFLKETVKNNAVIMLYRLTTNAGDLSGYFNTQNGFLFSANLRATLEPKLYQNKKHLILYCYASCVTNSIPTDEHAVYNRGEAVPFKVFGIGGKLKAAHNSNGLGKGEFCRDDATFERKTVPLKENIRKLPAGQKASDSAIVLARQWGYDLDPGETFVRPFCKEVFVKRQDQ